MRKFLIGCAVLASGCASTPQDYSGSSSGSLCVAYARAALNPNRDAWLAEVYRRGETCAPYAAEMGAASAQSQATLNSLNQRYAPAPAPQAAPGLTAYLVNNTIQGASRVCSYNALGTPHFLTLRAVDMCPLSLRVR